MNKGYDVKGKKHHEQIVLELFVAFSLRASYERALLFTRLSF